MKTTILKLSEINNLYIEISGRINKDTGEIISKGILHETLLFKTKFWLTTLSETLKNKVTLFETLKDELIKKYGVEQNSQIIITSHLENGEVNQNYILFTNEVNDLLNEDIQIEHKEFKLEDFEELKTDNNYIILYKLFSIN